jgi:predicted RNA-binding Zn ribbon-like protein
MDTPSNQDFQFIGGNLALDFVNTVANRLGQRRECLESAAAFNRWARGAGLLRTNKALRLTSRQLSSFHTIREELYRIFQPLALGQRPSAAAIARLNLRYSRVAGKRQLAYAQGQMSWRWRASRQDPDRVLGPILLSASELLATRPSSTLRQCRDKFCGWIFIDRSRAGCRRWCRMADCGNRAKIREYYRREKRKAQCSRYSGS